MEEVRYASWEFLREPDLEEDAPFFISGEADPSKSEPLDEFAVIPDFKNKIRYAPYVSLSNQISYIATNKG